MIGRVRWWVRRHGAGLSYLLIVVLVAGFFIAALASHGGW